MPDTLTPITREETYLAAIAGEDVSVPDPICRPEEFLAAIDGHIGTVESAVEDLEDIVPTPAAQDEGKVLTAGDDGTASWQAAGPAFPTPVAADKGKVLTAADETEEQTLMPEYSATFDSSGYTVPTNITIQPTAIPVGTVGTLHIGDNSYELTWVSHGGDNGDFGDPNGPDPCLGCYDGTWYIDYGPHSTTVTVSMTAELPTGDMGAKWQSESVLVNFTDSTAVATAVTSAVQAALTAADYLPHAGSASTAYVIPSTSGVTPEAFLAAVTEAMESNRPLVVNVAQVGVFNAVYTGQYGIGSYTAQIIIPSYNAVYGYVTLLLELFTESSALKGNVYAQQIKFPAP